MSETSAESGNAWPEGYSEAPVVVLVDDEANILSSMRRLLRPTGYRVHTAGGGEEALALLAEHPADLVISDMRMPGMDGAQLLEQVRQRWPEALRILLTGYADIQSTIAAINKGEIFRYIAKPWDDQEMLTTVRHALAQRGLVLEKRRLQALTAQQNEQLRTLNASLEDKVRERTAALEQTNALLHEAHENLKRGFFTSIQVFSNLIELRAGPLAGHSKRVAELGRRIAERLGMSAPEAQDVTLAGLLHDIGKIGFPDALLTRPVSQMNTDELGLLRKHPLKGAAALMALPELSNAARLIRAHHERFDGKGYPEGLSGLAIPLGARVLALANDYDGAQIGLPFPRKLSIEEAREWIAQGRGSRYDPKVVDAFIEIVGKPRPVQEPNQVRVSSADLKPGMVLARDLHSGDGALLLAADYILDAALIRQIREYEESEGVPLKLWIRAR